eukprot:TRINITY_DN33182_c0_g1_i1.p1 TRINITY_DN33182_c0_g1~~TRINITY_DN33182_c0_g1_i1.p1  ORF type:complete len:150 (+),score=27.13 TRINITY_DN33182_c0_g1_i1:188-637(+)
MNNPERFLPMPADLMDGPGPAHYVSADATVTDNNYHVHDTVMRPYAKPSPAPTRTVWARDEDGSSARRKVADTRNYGPMPYRNTLSGTACLPARPFVRGGSTWDCAYDSSLDHQEQACICLLYTSDAADEEDSVDLGGRRIIKNKKIQS